MLEPYIPAGMTEQHGALAHAPPTTAISLSRGKELVDDIHDVRQASHLSKLGLSPTARVLCALGPGVHLKASQQAHRTLLG